MNSRSPSGNPAGIVASQGKGTLTALRLLAALAILSGLFGSGGAVLAQGQPGVPGRLRIQQMRIQVMPEFDDPRVLVIVQGRIIAAENQFPMAVTFRLPVDAQINQMATVNLTAGGTLAEAFETRPDPDDGRWLLATYNLYNAHFFYEYYYDPLPERTDKDFTFVASSLYPVDDLIIEVQEPSAASGFLLEPEAGSSRLEPALKLRYHEVGAGRLQAGGEASVRVRYTKTDPAPSVNWSEVMGGHAADSAVETPAADVAASGVQFPAGLVIGLALAAVAVSRAVTLTRSRARSLAEAGIQPQRGPCPVCGTALKRGARYCHACGSPPMLGQEGSQDAF